MRVLMISPGFPPEMPYFTRGLARVGAHVVGLGDTPAGSLSPMARSSLSAYLRVDSIADERAVERAVVAYAESEGLDRIECLWEPCMMLAARLRERLGLPGMGCEQTTLFRDKDAMKRKLAEAGVRVPRHFRTASDEAVRRAAEQLGYPLIIKPIAGAGSADTYRVDDAKELESTLAKVRHRPELDVEEFVEGQEYTFDTICADGEMLFHSIAWYRPQPLIARTVEWLSPQTITYKEPDRPELAAGQALGRAVLAALGFRTGFTHMEWFLTPSGEAVFGEIAARSPGAHSVDLMNFANDFDSFTGWAEAVCHKRLTQPIHRRFHSAIVFKRAKGQGRISKVVGLDRLVARYRRHVVCVDLLPVGAPRRNWKNTLISDGFVIVRHQELDAVLAMADRFGTDLELHAG